MLLDRERCIQCARCTRFADEIAGDPLIDFINRGERTEVGDVSRATRSRRYFSGNTVQICPVGALTASPYRFKARPWDLEQVESTCTVCAVGCRIAVQSSANRLTRYLGLDSDPVNQSWLCDKGRFSFEAVNSDERLAAPQRSQGRRASSKCRGPKASRRRPTASATRATIHGPGCRRVSSAAPASPTRTPTRGPSWPRASSAPTTSTRQLGDGLPAEVVLGLPRATIDEACSASAVVLLAPDLKEELPVLYLRLRAAAVEHGVQARRAGARVHRTARDTPRPRSATGPARSPRWRTRS